MRRCTLFATILLLAVPALADPQGVPDLLRVVTPGGLTAHDDRFADPEEVYLKATSATGLPVDELPDGDYVFQVSAADGVLLLSSDRAICRLFRVEQGAIVARRDAGATELFDHEASDDCHVDDDLPGLAGPTGRHDSNVDAAGIVVQLMPFNATPDPEGRYTLQALPVELYLAYGGRILREPIPMGAGFRPDPGFAKAKVLLFDSFVVDTEGENTRPIADAGPDRSFALGDGVVLDGSASSDADGDPLSFSWTLAGPEGSSAALDDPTAVMPGFVPDLPGSYTATLVVNDGSVDSAPDQAVARSENTPPIADAGPDRTAEVGVPITLDGSGSSDIDGDSLSYSWRLPDADQAAAVQLDDADTVAPQLTVFSRDSYTLELVVNDGELLSEPDTMLVTSANRPPIADAGPDQSATLGQSVTLDGSGSSDPDFDPLVYSWSLTTPAGSLAELSNPFAIQPSFVVDLPGAYVAQLIVNDEELDSLPDTALITTTNAPPLADAGPDQTVTPGQTATLDGSGSSDPEGQPLAFAWSLLSAPQGSAAAIDDLAAAVTALPIDLPGTYVAQLIVDDGELASAPDTVMLSTGNVAPVADAGPDRVVLAGNVVTLDGTASTDADGDPLSFRWEILSRPTDSASVLFEPNSSTPSLFTDRAGDFVVQLIVNDGELDSPADSVVIAAEPNQRLLLETDSDLIGVERSVDGRVVALADIPAGGLEVVLSSDDATIADIAPLTLTIPEGERSAPVTVDGVALGTATLSADATGWFPASTAVTVTEFLVSVDLSLSLSPGQSAGLATSLSSVAPAGGQTIFLSSEDPSIATVTPSVFVPEGAQIPATNPQVTGVGIGQTRIVASSPGYAPAIAEIAVSLEMEFDDERLRLPLDTRNYRLRFSSPTPGDGLALQVTIDDPTIASAPSMLFVDGGVLTVDIPVTGLVDGITTLRVESPGLTEASGSIEVFSGITLSDIAIGRDLQRSGRVTLASPAPPAGRTVELSSSDASRLVLSHAPNEPGSGSISLFVVGGEISSESFYLQALAGDGSVEVSATAVAHTPETVVVPLVESGFGFVLLPIPTQGIFINTQDRDVALAVQPLALAPDTGAVLFGQQLRAGLNVAVAIEVDDPGLISLSDVPIPFVGGDGSNAASLDPLAAGNSTLRVVQPAGFSEPASRVALPLEIVNTTMFVTTPPHNRVVGYRLQNNVGIAFEAPGAAEPTDVTISVDDPTRILLAPPDGLSPGVSTLVVGNTTNGADIRIYGLDYGTATIDVSAPGFEPISVSYEVVPAGFRFANPLPPAASTTISGPIVVGIEPVIIWNTIPSTQSVRSLVPDIDGAVELQSSEPSVAAVGDPIALIPGGFPLQTTVQPLAEGVTTVSIVQPPNFFPPPNNTQRTLTVTAPDITVTPPFNGTIRTGLGLQTLHGFTLDTNPQPQPEVTLQIGDPSIATLSSDLDVDGTGTLIFPQGATSREFRIQGRALGTTTLTLSSPGFTPLVRDVEVTPSGFAFGSSFPVEMLTFAPNLDVSVYPYLVDATTGVATFINNQTVLPGTAPSIEVTSSAPGVFDVVGSPVTFQPGNLSRAVQFDPLTAGSGEAAVVQPPGFEASDRSQIAVSVEAPDVRLINATSTLGVDLQASMTVTLENVPPTPVDVTISSSNPGLVAISKDRAEVGAESVTFEGVTGNFVGSIIVQGLALGSVEVRAQAAGYDDAVRNVHVRPSGFVQGTTIDGFVQLGGTTTTNIRPAILDENSLLFAAFQELRAGVTAVVPLSNSDPTIAAIPASVTIVGGDLTTQTVTIEGLALGETTLTVEPVAGFDTPADRTERSFTVVE